MKALEDIDEYTFAVVKVRWGDPVILLEAKYPDLTLTLRLDWIVDMRRILPEGDRSKITIKTLKGEEGSFYMFPSSVARLTDAWERHRPRL